MLKLKTRSNTDLTHWPVTRPDPVKIVDPVTLWPGDPWPGSVSAIAIARVHPIHLMNADWAPDALTQTKPITDLGCEFADKWLLPSTSTFAIHRPKADTHFTVVPRRVEGWVDLGSAVIGLRVRSPCPRLYIIWLLWKSTTARGLSHRSQVWYHQTTATCICIRYCGLDACSLHTFKYKLFDYVIMLHKFLTARDCWCLFLWFSAQRATDYCYTSVRF